MSDTTPPANGLDPDGFAIQLTANTWPIWDGWAVRAVSPKADVTKRIRAAREKRIAQEQWVVELVGREAPFMLAGRSDMPPNPEWVASAIKSIEKVSGNSHRWRRNFFLRALNRGARELGWPSFPYQPVIALRLPNSPLNANTFPFVKRFRKLQQAFIAQLPDGLRFPESETRTVRKGRLLLSAVLFGGLCSRSRLRAFAGCNLKQQHAHGDLLWMDWQENHETSSGNWTRWFADPVTALLLAHACANDHWLLLEEDDGKTEELWPPIKAALASLGLPKASLPTSLRMLLDWGTAWLFRKLPPFLAHYASGALETSALPPHVLERILRGTRVSPQSIDSPAESPVEDIAGSTYRPQPAAVESVETTIRALRKILSGSKQGGDGTTGKKEVSRNREGIRNRLAEFRAGAELAPILQLLADWAIHRLQRKAGVTVVWREFEAIDRPLIERVGLDDPLAYESDRLSDVYQSIADLPSPKRRKGFRMGALADFHRFLIEHHKAKPVEADIFDAVTMDGQVDANVISFLHVREILDSLSPQASGHPPRIARSQQVAFLLSGRCALRRGEILRARLVDIAGAEEPSLVIRQRSGETLKSRQAERVVPLHALLLTDELDLIKDHIADVQREWETSVGAISLDEVMLLPREGDLRLALTEGSLFDPITLALHHVTGDTTLSIHNGRHSGIAMGILTLLEEILPGCSAILGGPLPENFRKHLRDVVLGVAEQSRQHLWAVSLIAGHLTPGITSGNYFHLNDWLLWYAFGRLHPDHLSPEKAAVLLGMSPQRYQRAIDRRRLQPHSAFVLLLEKVKEINRYATDTKESTDAGSNKSEHETAGEDVPPQFGIKSLDGKPLTASQLLVLLDQLDTFRRSPEDRTGTKTKNRVMPASTTLSSLAARNGVSEAALEQLDRIVDSLPHIAETRPGFRAKRDARAGTTPPVALDNTTLDFPVPPIRVPRSGHDRQLVARIYEALKSSWERDPATTAKWLVEHWRYADFETPTYRFDSSSVARAWLLFLLDLRFRGKPVLTIDDFDLTHAPGSPANDDASESHRSTWATALDVPRKRIGEADPSKRRQGVDGIGLLKVALKYPKGMSRNWSAAREKRGVANQRPRIGSMALNVAAYLVLIQGITYPEATEELVAASDPQQPAEQP